MSEGLDLDLVKKYNPGLYDRFDNNLADMLLDALQGDPKVLNLPEIQSLGADNIKAALEWLQKADVNGDYLSLLMNEGWRLQYKRKPPSPEEYLTPEWIGAQAEGLWPNVKKAFVEFVDPNPLNPKRGLALSTSIGWGKEQGYDSNIIVDKKIKIELEDDTKLETSADETLNVLKKGEYIKITANQLLKMDLSDIDLPQSIIKKYSIKDKHFHKRESGSIKIKKVDFEYIYKKMGDLKQGDEVLGPGGEKHKILEIYEQGMKDLYKITVSDGRSFEAGLEHLTTVHFRNSHVRPDKKTYDTLTTKYIMDNLDKYLFEIPTDETFSWNELDYPQFLEMLPCHEYEPIDEEFIVPDLKKDPEKIYIEKIEKLPEQKNCRCIALDYPWGLYLVEKGLITHNSLLTNLCMSYIMTHFCLMRNPYRILGHSQPVYEKVQLPDGKYTTIADLKIGMKIAGVVQKESEVLDIIDQGEKDTYELEFENNLKCRCSMDHLWTVWDTECSKYVILPLRLIVLDRDRFLFPELSDCEKDRDLMLKAEQDFSNGTQVSDFQSRKV